MDYSEIKKGMLVYHITNPKIKMLVRHLFSSQETQDAPCVWCEWMSKDGIYQYTNFIPANLKEYKKSIFNRILTK